MIKNIPLIKEIASSFYPKDPIQEAIDSLSDDEMHNIDEDQLETLVDYMREMIEHAKARGNTMPPSDAAGMALEDVAGFETAPPEVERETINRLVRDYVKKFGA